MQYMIWILFYIQDTLKKKRHVAYRSRKILDFFKSKISLFCKRKYRVYFNINCTSSETWGASFRLLFWSCFFFCRLRSCSCDFKWKVSQQERAKIFLHSGHWNSLWPIAFAFSTSVSLFLITWKKRRLQLVTVHTLSLYSLLILCYVVRFDFDTIYLNHSKFKTTLQLSAQATFVGFFLV